MSLNFGSGSQTSTTSGTTSTKGTSSGSSKSSQSIAPMSGTEKGLTGNLASFNPNYMDPSTSFGTSGLANLYSAGMQPTGAQKSGLKSIEQSQLAADKQGLNFSMFGPGGWMNQINNQMADRGMTNSSVDTMAQTGAVENAQNLMNQDVQGANQQYQQGMLNLPFQNANVLSGLASLGLNISGQNAGVMQGLLGLLTQRDMANATQTGNFNQATNQTQNYNQTTSGSMNNSGFGLSLSGKGTGALAGLAFAGG
ncbi:MAG: hypothetical protein ACYCR5_04480 [Leptospirillum sp.]